MGKFWTEIPDDNKLVDWVREQQLFHVATAPLNGGHVNVSPKGLPSFKLVNRKACYYLDFTGSGNETISHIYEPGNGRLTIMFEAFQGPPRILRLFGKGKVFERGTPEFDKILEGEDPVEDIFDFPTPENKPGARAILWLDIELVSTTCGYSVPFYTFEGHRDVLYNWCGTLERNDHKAEDPFSLPAKKGLKSYWLHVNTWSIDGLPGFKQVANRVNKNIIESSMREFGLDPKTVMRKGSFDWFTVLVILFVGIVTGFCLATMVNDGMFTVAQNLLRW